MNIRQFIIQNVLRKKLYSVLLEGETDGSRMKRFFILVCTSLLLLEFFFIMMTMTTTGTHTGTAKRPGYIAITIMATGEPEGEFL